MLRPSNHQSYQPVSTVQHSKTSILRRSVERLNKKVLILKFCSEPVTNIIESEEVTITK